MAVRVICSIGNCRGRAASLVKNVALCQRHRAELRHLARAQGSDLGSLSREDIVRLLERFALAGIDGSRRAGDESP
jgi:hypothetical protein